MGERLGILGGTFDPVHNGHLLLARSLHERLRLDRVLFIPAADPPHKETSAASAEQRYAMVCLAVRGIDSFSVSPIELERDGPSYTIDTLRQLGVDHPEAHLYLLIGSDNVADLSSWVDPEGILALATVVAGARTIEAQPAPLAARIQQLDTPTVDISSTWIRKKLLEGQSIQGLVPDAVDHYIVEHNLYRTP